MKHTLKYFSSLFLLFVSFSVMAQEAEQKKDTIKSKYPQKYGLRIGVDLHRLTKSFYDNNFKGLEFVGDYRITKRFYVAGEIGREEKLVNDDMISYTTKGNYLKVGFDFNGYENWLDMQNLIYVGMRAGFGNFNQTLHSYSVFQPTSYYGVNTQVSGQEWKGLTASWIEVVAGLKAEVLKNVYVGFSARLNYLLSQKQPDGFANHYIPGYNKTYEGSKFGAGFNYSISYFLPLYKSKK